MSITRRAALALLLASAALVAPTSPIATASTSAAREDDPPTYLGWTSLVPPRVGTYSPSSADDCRAGRAQCLRRTLAQMRSHLDLLAARCDHDAVFAMTYLRTTEEYGRAVAEPGFFADPRFLNHWDAVFADYYVRAYDDWHAGQRSTVAPAWRVAFTAAEEQSVSGSGNLLLGISAHVNRDLPFVLASIGMTAPDGSSRKPDHDQVNVFLNRVAERIPREGAERFDPTMDDALAPLGLTGTALMQLLVSWREGAWRNAERLVAAPDDAARERVAADIERSSEATGRAIAATAGYAPPVTSAGERNHWCATRGRR